MLHAIQRCPATPFVKGSPTDARSALRRAKVGGEGRTRTFEAARATDLQSAAFDRFATSPILCVFVESVLIPDTYLADRIRSSLELAKGIEPPTC